MRRFILYISILQNLHIMDLQKNQCVKLFDTTPCPKATVEESKVAYISSALQIFTFSATPPFPSEYHQTHHSRPLPSDMGRRVVRVPHAPPTKASIDCLLPPSPFQTPDRPNPRSTIRSVMDEWRMSYTRRQRRALLTAFFLRRLSKPLICPNQVGNSTTTMKTKVHSLTRHRLSGALAV